jgi:hypothetical protein
MSTCQLINDHFISFPVAANSQQAKVKRTRRIFDGGDHRPIVKLPASIESFNIQTYYYSAVLTLIPICLSSNLTTTAFNNLINNLTLDLN